MSQSAEAPTGNLLEAEYAIPPRERFNPLRWARREPAGALGVFLILLIAFGSGAAPILRTTNPQTLDAFTPNVLVSPGSEFFFGTDRQGKDVWSSVLYGGRISLKIGVATVLVGTVGGTLLALVAGFLGGVVDFTFSRLADMIIAIPALLLALVIDVVLGDQLPDLPALPKEELARVLAISLFFMPSAFRIMRGSVLEQRSGQYVEAATLIGAGQIRIMLRHILPNITGLMIVLTTISLPAAILTEATLSFLLGSDAPSWGAELSGDSRRFFNRAQWIAIFPGAALALAVFAFNIFGDSIRDSLDPRLRGRI
ncbi:MAG: peptide ABC transporter permease [Dehalococcoidia bacterium]|nr:peptide ABC transporter permease [Dehalococcoidia bacterium]|tara:strand:- start:291 stop:1226 length:936 start_codon:yes stop_codon:yes gene_type:complete